MMETPSPVGSPLPLLGFALLMTGVLLADSHAADASDRAAGPGAPTAKVAHTTTWLGNTFGSADGQSIQTNISSIAVAADGTVYPIAQWEEAGKAGQLIKDGEPGANPGSIMDILYGGDVVAINRKYVYYAQALKNGMPKEIPGLPPYGKFWVGLTRRLRSDPAQGATFEGAMGGYEGIPRMFLRVNELPWEGKEASLSGMAADDRRLYVSDPYAEEVKIYDAESMALVDRFPLARPGRMALDRQGTLWIVQNPDAATAAKILRYSAEGVALPEVITDVVRPAALAVDNEGHLMVAENGPRQQVLFFKTTGDKPELVKTFGETGGIYAGERGVMGDRRLNGPNAVGMDAAGNLYVNSGASGTDLRAFSPSGGLLWRALGVVFVDAGAADPRTDGTDVYTLRDHFTFDYGKRNGREWALAAHTVDRFTNPHDPRLSEAWLRSHLSAHSIQWIGGKKFLFVTDQAGATFQIYKFEGEIAKPSVIFGTVPLQGWVSAQPDKGRYIWRDKNNDGDFQSEEFEGDGHSDEYAVGWDVDGDGNVWHSQEEWFGPSGPIGPIRQFPFQGLDAHGNPVYSYASLVSYPAPPAFKVVTRLRYLRETDTLYLSGYTHENDGGDEPLRLTVGTELARYDGWTDGNRTPRWRAALPHDASTRKVIHSWDVAGQRIFAGFLAGGANGDETVRVYATETGAHLGNLWPGPEIGNNANWIDMAYGVRAFQRSDGEYVVFVEDVIYGKTIVYRGEMTP